MTTNLSQWLTRFADGAPLANRDDEHVDRLDSKLCDRTRWIDGSLDLLQQAEVARSLNAWPIALAIEFFLLQRPKVEGMPPGGLAGLLPQLSHTPPAMVVYRRGNEPWRRGFPFTELVSEETKLLSSAWRMLFQEWYDEDEGDYDRRLWIVSENR